MRIALAFALAALVSTGAAAKPAHHNSASVCSGGCNAGANLPLGTMQTNPNAWNYGMIHVKGGWSITPQSGWYTFANNMLTFAADLPALMGHSSAVALSQTAPHNHAPYCQVGRFCR